MIEKKIPKRRAGWYYLEGLEPMVSVTTVLKVIDKPALLYWASQSMFRMLVADPTKMSDEKKAIMEALYQPRDKAGEHGSKAHEVIDEEEKGGSYNRATLSPEVNAYLIARDKFIADHPQLEVVLSETIGYSLTEKYAGQIDRIAHNKSTNENWLIDWKTSNGVYKESGLQLVAYKNFEKIEDRKTGKFIDMPKIDKLVVVHLKNDSTYNLIDFSSESFDDFKSVKRVYEWSQKRKNND